MGMFAIKNDPNLRSELMGDPRLVAVLLAGGIRRSKLHEQTGTHPLYLPLRSDVTTIQLWIEAIRSAAGDIHILVVGGGREELEAAISREDRARVEYQFDPRNHRGTAGVLADLTAEEGSVMASAEQILVIDGSSCPPRTLKPFFERPENEAGIVFGVSEIDRLAGCMLLRSSVLELVPAVGYFDMKEQLAGKLASTRNGLDSVMLIERAITINSLDNWLLAARFQGGWDAHQESSSNQGAFRRHQCCVSESAVVGRAMVVNSIIMRGAVIGDGAIVARSAIGEGVRVPENAHVVDGLVWK